MVLLLFDRLPVWMPGCYGGTATPGIDGLAAVGRVEDAAFVTDRDAAPARHFDVRRHPGVPEDLTASPPPDCGRLNDDVTAADWEELLELWAEDGFDVEVDGLSPADLPDLLGATPDLLSDDLRYESDAAARAAAAIERLHLADADRWVAAQTHKVPPGEPVALTAAAGGTPLPRPEETLLDIARQVPLIVGGGPAGRVGRLTDASAFLRTGRVEAVESLSWSDHTGEAVRTPGELLLQESTPDGPFVRRFTKPDDRFCQLNVARPGERVDDPT